MSGSLSGQLATMRHVADLENRLDDLIDRVAALERGLAVQTHAHNYRYSKTMYENPADGVFWSWKCLDDEGVISKDCPHPSGGTNHRSGIPDHFPDPLR